MALNNAPDEISITLDKNSAAFSCKFVGSDKDVLFLWTVLASETADKLGIPLQVLLDMTAHVAPTVAKKLAESSGTRINFKLPRK